MSTVYSFSGFARTLIKNGIVFSIRDFLDPVKVDVLIEELIKKICQDYNYVGAGISRACFLDSNSETAVKVSKCFYINIEDEIARDEYYENYGYDEYEDYGGGWAFNNLHKAVSCTYSDEDQNYTEIETYERFLNEQSEWLNYIPKLYAVSSNWNIEIMEGCLDYYSCSRPGSNDVERKNKIENYFNDTHYNNFGYNRQGKLVILDFGIM